MDHFLKPQLSVKTFREIKKYQNEKILLSFGFGLSHVDYRLHQHFICQVSTNTYYTLFLSFKRLKTEKYLILKKIGKLLTGSSPAYQVLHKLAIPWKTPKGSLFHKFSSYVLDFSYELWIDQFRSVSLRNMSRRERHLLSV